MTDTAREQLGRTDGPVEDEVTEAFDRIVSEGAQRLHRTWWEVLATGLAGGIEIATGLLALVTVYAATGSHLLAGLAFSVGFVALVLARSELFTEGFLVPVTAVVAGRAHLRQLGKLWGGTLAANLLGGWFVTWLIVRAFPELRGTVTVMAAEFVGAPPDGRTISLAVLAGVVMTLMTRMQHGTTSDVAKVFAAVVGGFLIGGLQLFHSIVESLMAFAALHADAPFGYLDWLEWFWYVALFNLLGGLLVVTLTRMIRSKELIQRERARARAGD